MKALCQNSQTQQATPWLLYCSCLLCMVLSCLALPASANAPATIASSYDNQQQPAVFFLLSRSSQPFLNLEIRLYFKKPLLRLSETHQHFYADLSTSQEVSHVCQTTSSPFFEPSTIEIHDY